MLRRAILLAALLAAALTFIGGSPATPAAAQAGCSAAYPDFCIPPSPDVNCPDAVIAGRVNFTALAPDPHNLDTDRDGIACEDSTRPRFATTTTAAPVTTTTAQAVTTTTLATQGVASLAQVGATTTTTVASTTPTTVRTAAPAATQAPQVLIALTG